jgi:methylated-DNA-[protein]-cysteine S-methyltransferase
MSTLELRAAAPAAQDAPTVHTVVGSPVGELTLVAAGGKLTGLYFPHHWYLPDPVSFGPRSDAGFGAAARQLAAYFDGRLREFDLPAELHGDAFQLRVWQLIRAIGYGQTVSYGELAAQLGDGTQARDVGAAVGRNPLSIVVPCHRVVGKDGRLTGYAGGLRRKRFLLDLEQAAGRLF